MFDPTKTDRFGRPVDLAPRYGGLRGDTLIISEDATYIGLGMNGAVVSTTYQPEPPTPRRGITWVPARLVNLGDVGR